jgi:hypothetical protein
MTGPANAGEPVALTDGGTEIDPYRDGVVAFGHPRGALRAIPRYPLDGSDIEAMHLAFSRRPISDTSGKAYPVAQGGIPAYGT